MTENLNEQQEPFICENCGKKLDEHNEYHLRFGVCNEDCYMEMVGMSWSDFL